MSIKMPILSISVISPFMKQERLSEILYNKDSYTEISFELCLAKAEKQSANMRGLLPYFSDN